MSFHDRVPVSELPQELSGEDYFAFQLNLSHQLDEDRLMVDVGRLRTTGRLAGLSGIVMGQYYGEQSPSSAPDIVGINLDGTAVAARSKAESRSPIQQSHLNGNDPRLEQDYQWPEAHIQVNRTELTDRVLDRKRSGTTTEQAWAKELNHALQSGIRSAARANLIPLANGTTRLEAGCTVFATSVVIYPTPVTVALLGALHGGYLAISTMCNKRSTGESHLDKRRWSLFAGGQFQADRLALSSLLNCRSYITYAR